jgi:hypothetical protein
MLGHAVMSVVQVFPSVVYWVWLVSFHLLWSLGNTYFRIWVQTWLVMLSHAVMGVVQVFPSFVMLRFPCVFLRDCLPSIEMWFDRGEDRCCGLSKVGKMKTVGFCHVMWFVMLRSAKDRILGVDTPGQLVPPHVWYGTACLLIRYAIGYVSCSVEWGWHHTFWSYFVTYFVICLNHMVQEGTFVRETLALQAGTICSENRSEAWHTPVVDLCNKCSDLWAIHPRNVIMAKRRFL